MVRTSRRKLLITTLEESINDQLTAKALDFLLADHEEENSSSEYNTDCEDDKCEDKDMEIADLEAKAKALGQIQGKRYLGGRHRIEKGPDAHHFLLNRMQEYRFKQFFRMSRSSFFNLCQQIEGNPVFHNNSNHPQRPVIEQMMVALNRFGCFGNGVAVGIIATYYRIGDGTVELYTNRCIMAIVALQSQLLTWPNNTARKIIKESYKEVGFDGCVGLIDGTLVVLSTCPEKDGPDYYNRKGFYGIVTLLVCDENKNIIYVYTGWPGCSHNQRLMSNCTLNTCPTDFFAEGEYLLANSAFVPTANTVPAFRRKKNKPLTDEQHNFNRHLSGVRVGIENCIGLLKNRFQSLKGLRLRIASKKDMVCATAWIMACAILHNYLNKGSDLDFDDFEPETDDPDDEFGNRNPAEKGTVAGKRRQQEVLKLAREFREEDGRY